MRSSSSFSSYAMAIDLQPHNCPAPATFLMSVQAGTAEFVEHLTHARQNFGGALSVIAADDRLDCLHVGVERIEPSRRQPNVQVGADGLLIEGFHIRTPVPRLARMSLGNDLLKAGADARTRTGTGLLPRDFKSLASTIPPRPRGTTPAHARESHARAASNYFSNKAPHA